MMNRVDLIRTDAGGVYAPGGPYDTPATCTRCGAVVGDQGLHDVPGACPIGWARIVNVPAPTFGDPDATVPGLSERAAVVPLEDPEGNRYPDEVQHLVAGLREQLDPMFWGALVDDLVNALESVAVAHKDLCECRTVDLAHDVSDRHNRTLS